MEGWWLAGASTRLEARGLGRLIVGSGGAEPLWKGGLGCGEEQQTERERKKPPSVAQAQLEELIRNSDRMKPVYISQGGVEIWSRSRPNLKGRVSRSGRDLDQISTLPPSRSGRDLGFGLTNRPVVRFHATGRLVKAKSLFSQRHTRLTKPRFWLD